MIMMMAAIFEGGEKALVKIRISKNNNLLGCEVKTIGTTNWFDIYEMSH